MPRPEHPKKADAQTIVASKNKISIQEEKKALLKPVDVFIRFA
ncbi:transposase [Streptococcus pneumoniae 1542]|nr:transposase [Streptococcus pneumoniae 1542]